MAVPIPAANAKSARFIRRVSVLGNLVRVELNSCDEDWRRGVAARSGDSRTAPRTKSRLMPLMPANTVLYAASPNYGATIKQVLEIFRKHRENSEALREWWARGEAATGGRKLEQSLDQSYELSQYFGDEIVVSGAMNKKDMDVVMVSEVRK